MNNKYLKYKNKYLLLKQQIASGNCRIKPNTIIDTLKYFSTFQSNNQNYNNLKKQIFINSEINQKIPMYTILLFLQLQLELLNNQSNLSHSASGTASHSGSYSAPRSGSHSAPETEFTNTIIQNILYPRKQPPPPKPIRTSNQSIDTPITITPTQPTSIPPPPNPILTSNQSTSPPPKPIRTDKIIEKITNIENQIKEMQIEHKDMIKDHDEKLDLITLELLVIKDKLNIRGGGNEKNLDDIYKQRLEILIKLLEIYKTKLNLTFEDFINECDKYQKI
jgi:hypothetical protein